MSFVNIPWCNVPHKAVYREMLLAWWVQACNLPPLFKFIIVDFEYHMTRSNFHSIYIECSYNLASLASDQKDKHDNFLGQSDKTQFFCWIPGFQHGNHSVWVPSFSIPLSWMAQIKHPFDELLNMLVLAKLFTVWPDYNCAQCRSSRANGTITPTFIRVFQQLL